MNQRTKRFIFYFTFALLCLWGVLHLQGCAAEYTWARAYPPAKKAQWKVVPRAEVYERCNANPDKAPTLAGWAFWSPEVCTVYSYMTGDRAKQTMSGDGIELWTHELKHCDGFVHSEHRRG